MEAFQGKRLFREMEVEELSWGPCPTAPLGCRQRKKIRDVTDTGGLFTAELDIKVLKRGLGGDGLSSDHGLTRPNEEIYAWSCCGRYAAENPAPKRNVLQDLIYLWSTETDAMRRVTAALLGILLLVAVSR
jgi:hypothetical protein